MYTLDELTELVGAALSVDYDGAPTARVRDVPDQRAIRWYVTRGLVDRPATRGRLALYGRRHLLQLVAIKRRQADGRSLAEIQAELAGATDRTLATVARLAGDPLPADALAEAPRRAAGKAAAPARARFWAHRPAAELPDRTASSESTVDCPTQRSANGPPASTVDFTRPRSTVDQRGRSVALQGIRLAPGVTLLIENGTADPADVYAAARPLLDLLADGGPACEEEL